MRTALNVLSVCSFASPSPAVGLLCDGACMKRIGGTFHTLGAAWWGVGSGLMNRVHLAKSRGPQDSLVQPRFTDQSRVIPASSSHTHTSDALSSLESLWLFHPPIPKRILRSLPRSFNNLQNAPHETHLILPPVLELPVSPDAHGEP